MAYQVEIPGRRVGATNLLVELRGFDDSGHEIIGVGEGQPRDGLTGDRTATSWEFLSECVRRLYRRDIEVTDAPAAVETVRATMGEFRTLAEDYEADANRPVPFRGTLLALEVALLDLLSQALEVSLAELLGVRRTSVRAQGDEFPATLLTGTDSVDENIAILEKATDSIGVPGKQLWLDVGGRLNRQDASALVKAVADAVAAGRVCGQVILEQPVAAIDYDLLPRLQRLADRAAAKRADADVQIMADQSLWRPETLGRRARALLRARRLVGGRTPRAVCIRPAQVGGLLDSIALAEKIQSTRRQARIYLGSMPGGTQVSGGAVRNLAMVLPGIDAVADETLADEAELTALSTAGIGASTSYEAALSGVKDLLALPEPEPPAHGELQVNGYDEVDVIRPLGLNFTKGYLLEREALARGLSTKRFTRSAFIATDGRKEPLGFKRSRTPLSSALSMALCTHKEATRLQLQRAGVPVPRGRTFVQGDYESARAFVDRIGYPVVVKPAMGVSGAGVAANIRDEHALQRAFDGLEATRFGSGDFIVEQHIRGNDHRIVVVGDEVVGAIMRDPASVDGDGKRSIAELVIAKNAARRLNPHLWGRPIKYDDAARAELERAGLTLDDVPAPGQRVTLSHSGNLALGADSVDVLDTVHPSIKEACIQAVRAVPGMTYCGIDFLLEDHSKPLDEQQAAICELNAHAAIGNCEYPIYGKPREVARRLIEQCIEQFELAANPERADRLALKLTIRGRVSGVGYRAWMERKAKEFGVTGWVRNVDERSAEAVIVGELIPASALAAAAVTGPRAAQPTEVITTHIQEPALDGFRVVTSAPKGGTGAR
jgi:D-alanine-D-alanine ligase-like ATP-grasp enzyme/acylphosphatase/L-alanine-DL-glutamate epimerase-like enolase superfamily enzyme